MAFFECVANSGTSSLKCVGTRTFSDGSYPTVSFSNITIGNQYIIVTNGYQPTGIRSLGGATTLSSGGIQMGEYRIIRATSTTISVTATVTGNRNSEGCALFTIY